MSQYGVPFTYDSNGNLKTAPGRVYAYSPENLVETVSVDNVVNTYEYDADGWRIKKVTPANVTYYLRGLAGELLTEWSNPGPSGVIRDYVYAGAQLIGVVTGASPSDFGDVVGTLAVGGSPVSITMASANEPRGPPNARKTRRSRFFAEDSSVSLTTSAAVKTHPLRSGRRSRLS